MQNQLLLVSVFAAESLTTWQAPQVRIDDIFYWIEFTLCTIHVIVSKSHLEQKKNNATKTVTQISHLNYETMIS